MKKITTIIVVFSFILASLMYAGGCWERKPGGGLKGIGTKPGHGNNNGPNTGWCLDCARDYGEANA